MGFDQEAVDTMRVRGPGSRVHGSRSKVLGPLGILIAILATAACGARAEVRTPTDVPMLVPAPPPDRLIVPVPERPTLPDPEPPISVTPPANTTVRSQPPVRPIPLPAPPPPAGGAPPPAVLSTTANTADFERRIREQVRRAEADLAQVNRQSLGSSGKAQYDAARGFIRQCDEALKVRNLVFAGQLADKAATMAALLRR